MPPLSHDLTQEEAQEILRAHLPGVKVQSLETFSASSHIVRLANGQEYLLKLVPSAQHASKPIYAPNTIPAQYALLCHLSTQPQGSSLPIPTPVAHGSCAEKLYLLTGLPDRASTPGLRTLSSVRAQLSPRAIALVDLQIGRFLHRLHDVQNASSSFQRARSSGTRRTRTTTSSCGWTSRCMMGSWGSG